MIVGRNNRRRIPKKISSFDSVHFFCLFLCYPGGCKSFSSSVKLLSDGSDFCSKDNEQYQKPLGLKSPFINQNVGHVWRPGVSNSLLVYVSHTG